MACLRTSPIWTAFHVGILIAWPNSQRLLKAIGRRSVLTQGAIADSQAHSCVGVVQQDAQRLLKGLDGWDVVPAIVVFEPQILPNQTIVFSDLRYVFEERETVSLVSRLNPDQAPRHQHQEVRQANQNVA